MDYRQLLRKVIPFPIRLELLRLRRLPMWLREHPDLKPNRAAPHQISLFSHLLAEHSSPLDRETNPGRLQRGKETNIRLASNLIDGVTVNPGETFSHHHTIGRTSRRRGFRHGLELRDGRAIGSIGGGLCQISNSFYWVALRAGMEIVERHRHGLDLFPDNARTVPFGCGATVVYNYADFRFRNTLTTPVLLHAAVENGHLITSIRTTSDPGRSVRIEERDHRFYQIDGGWFRENRIFRLSADDSDSEVHEEQVAHNHGRVMYSPTFEA